MKEPGQKNVKKGVWKGQRVMIKELRSTKDEASFVEEKASFLREVNILKGLADRHIIQYYHHTVEEEPKLVMESAEAGDLKGALPKLQWEDKVRIIGEIAHGLWYIHSLGIIHCDIKSKNVLLTKNLVAKICDFGSAMTITDIKNNTAFLGTTGWVAPEAKRDPTAYSPEADIYSLGIIMWEMASGEVSLDRSQVVEERLKHVPLEFYSTMQACLDQDPKCRPDARTISYLKAGCPQKEMEMMEYLSQSVGETIREQSRYGWGGQRGAEVDTHADDGDIIYFRFDAAGVPRVSFNVREDRKRDMILYYQGLEHARQISDHARAYLYLGEIYRNGYGVDQNNGEAHIWYFRAAKAGCRVSQHRMGVSCFRADNYVKAVEWYRKSAEQEFPDGQYKMGVMLYYGHGVPKDHDEATSWIRKAADQGNRSAMTGMGLIFMDQKRYGEAMEWFLKTDNNRISQYHIGLMYYHGLGVRRDYAAAAHWYKLAAGEEYGLAEYAMGTMYHYGKGNARADLEEAKKWYLKAIEHGQASAIAELGLAMTLTGKRSNLIQGSRYLMEASMDGNLLARANLLLQHL
ncbi:hypothetical protein BGZ51_004949 [Haplosporangium sp. Z 767]|nr:hypothetical protein BGZ50_005522 [Haplosporangium sp. Z 11]KAF9182134.1 hypothetical protein BGZ51_004949 [Haplosporangium sp. Z 767]